jgi:hypothetical protein
MLKLASATQYVFIPVTGPSGVNLANLAVSVALILESAGGEPADTDYQSATWVNGEAALLVTPSAYAAGEYLAFVRVVAPPEDIRLFAGRVRIGDARV